MSTDPVSRSAEAASVFRRSQEVIHSTLVSLYGISAEDAQQLEAELSAWFDRLSRRSGTPDSVQSLRPHLFSMVCKLGHVFWSARMDLSPPKDDLVKRSLFLGPDVMATEIETRFKSRAPQRDSDQ